MLLQFCRLYRYKHSLTASYKNNFVLPRASPARNFELRKSHLLSTILHSNLKFVRNNQLIKRWFSTNKIQKLPVDKEIKRLLHLAKTEKWRLGGAVLLLLISSSVTMSVPYCVGKLIDTMVQTGVESNLLAICQILIVVFALGAIANCGRVYLMNISSQRIINNLRKKVYSSILQQETSFFDTRKTGELINRLSADTAAVGMSVTNNISDGLRSLFSFIAGSSLMIYTSPELASLGLLTVAPVAVLALFFSNILKTNSRNVQDALASATQVAEERISNIRTVQAFLKIQEENKLYEDKVCKVLDFAKKESMTKAIFFGINGFAGNLIILTVLYYGGHMMNESIITVGALSSFLMYAAYVGISIGGMGSFYSELMKGLGASSKLWELIDRKSSIPLEGGTILTDLKGDLKFSNVIFAYPSRPNVPVLNGFNLSIPAGSLNALVGPSGCGKSTVGSLLLRLYDYQSGTISIDGKNVTSLNVQWLRKNIGIVSQEPILFSFSIRENILYGSHEGVAISDNVIEDNLAKANALDFVKNMPNGLDTVVGERGVMLSGGQRQRLAIARALIKDPKILILDEATSALDVESEYLVQQALEKLMKNRTVITIAHRLSTIKQADFIIVMENGKVTEKGKYDELVSAHGSFYRLVQHQTLKS